MELDGGGKAADGNKGADGGSGMAGAGGASGLHGNDAANGNDGIAGPGGNSGKAGAANGLSGKAGEAGAIGETGALGAAGGAGNGGVGVRGTGDTTVINDGFISGGLSEDGRSRAASVRFTNGGNRLELHSQSVIVGNAVASHDPGEIDTLALGGDADSSFDVTEIGSKYIGFNAFDKSGNSTWVLTGNTAQVTPWTVSKGVLSVSREENLGAVEGELTFRGGTLQVTGTSFTGTDRAINISNGGGTIEIVDSSICFDVRSAISGDGGLKKTGAGSLELNASNTYTGLTDVTQGRLVIGSSEANADASVAGNALVRYGASLAGYGTVLGTLTNSGTVDPGSCLHGTVADLRIGGDYIQRSNGTLDIDFRKGTNDRLIVGGSAVIDGNFVVHVEDNPDWYQRHVVIDAAGGVTGVFSSATDGAANIDSFVIYDPNQVVLQLFRNDVIFRNCVPNLTKNEISTATALDDLPRDGTIYRNILIEGEANAPQTFDAFSGEIHADITSAIIGGSAAGRATMMENLRNGLDGETNPSNEQVYYQAVDAKSGLPEMHEGPPRVIDDRRLNVWAEAIGDQLTLDGDGNAATMDQDLVGLFAGVNADIVSGWQGGFAAGYTSGDVDVAARRSSADIDNVTFGLTLGKSFEMGENAINLLLGASRTWSDIDTTRNVTVGNINDQYTASYDATTDQLFGELGYEMRIAERSIVEPFMNVAWIGSDTDSYQERGGVGALSGKGTTQDQVVSLIGVRFDQIVDAGSLPARLRASVAWQHAFGDTYDTATHSFAGSNPFTVEGAAFDEDAAVLELGADLRITDSTTIGATYTGRFSENNQNNTLRANLNWRF